MNYSPFNDHCSPITVNFQVTSETVALGPTSYDWFVTDNGTVVHSENTGTNTNFSYTFSNNIQAPKDYDVRLQANFSSGCPADTTTTVRVNPIPRSTFGIDTLEVTCNFIRVEVSADQKGLERYEWRIRENGIMTFNSDMVGDSFEFTFNRTANNRSVEIDLETENFSNCVSNITTNNFNIPASSPVEAIFNVNPPEQSLPNTTFSISNGSTGDNLTYFWDFGDGNTSTSADPGSHTYDTHGDYLISLRVEGELGCADSISTLVRVHPIPPTVDFSYDPANGCAPLTVQFTNLSEYADPDSYFWDFGDGFGTSRSENPVYTYTQPGLYTVSLSASNVTGDTITETKVEIIEVFSRPIADFTIKSSVLYLPDDIMYIRNDSRFASRYEWDFGDGNTSTEPQPKHQYTEEGFYDITLTAYNDQGCKDVLTMESIIQTKNAGRLLVPNAFTPNLYGPTGGGLGED
ncbi:MAG: PKD domain-containing protein [Cyclobacteriaceae bacterium]